MLYNNNVSFSSHLLVPATAAAHGFLYVMIYLTEQCNRHTVHYSLWLENKACCVCSWPARDTRSHYGAVRLSHTALSLEVTA